jgi:two-component system cell cycle sensor histidine kinase/response regulator CckA
MGAEDVSRIASERLPATTCAGGQARAGLTRAERAILALIVARAELPRVLGAMCTAIEDAFPGTACSVLLMDDERRHLRHGAAPSLPPEYVRLIDGIEIGPSVGSCGAAAYSRTTVISTDIATDPSWRGLEAIPARFALAACASMPIFSGRDVLGSFAIYHHVAGPFDRGELELLSSMSDLAAIAIINHARDRALEESEERQARTASLARAIETEIGIDGRWLRAPPVLAELLGRTEEELIETPLQALLHPDDLEVDRDDYQGLISGALESIELRSRLLRKDGGVIWASLNCTSVKDPEGKPHHIRVHVTDITEKKRIEDSLRRAQKMEGLGLLAAGLGHDLNNLLAAVLCNLNVAQLDVGSSTRVGEALHDAEGVIRRAAGLTRQMLGYAGGRATVGLVDINVAIRDVEKILSAAFLKNVSVELDLRADLPPFMGDATQVQQVLMNLVINAAQAIGPVGGTIRVATSVESRSGEAPQEGFVEVQPAPSLTGEHVVLEVSDTGSGIAPESLRAIFEPFYTTKTSGRGLGLAVLRGILTDHRAGLAVSSKVGRGTTFRVQFPAVKRSSVPPGPGSAASSWPAAHGTVLVVDDEAVVRRAVVQMVRALGFDAVEAEDGESAVLQLVKHTEKITLVLLDVAMPGMGGLEALEPLRARAPRARIILTTGGRDVDLAGGAAGGAPVEVLHKPYGLVDLRRAIFGS